ncbi:hypothetical protein C8F01DRAFT_1092544 [Mycena amicta]|nr:hypothetical protein C8F01DRAFT_1092544 [Mycena amicta]
MYYRDYDEDAASTGSGSASSTPPTPSADHRLFALPSARAPITGAWTAHVGHGHSETTKEVLQSVLKVRKSWKTLRGGETVWPLELEAALLEGLESYVPDDSRETRLLGRFPRRNRFISDYIFDKTGKRRSAKQVGSRLQQLRESCGGKKLLHLLSPFRQPYPESSASSDSACTSPVSPVLSPQGFPSGSGSQPSYTRHTIVYIDILPDDADADMVPPSPTWDSDDPNRKILRASDRARPLRMINPSVAFVSPTQVNAQSHFTVYAGDRIMHAESVPLIPAETSSHVAGVLYSAALVPEYWRTISASPDPTRFTIYQEVLKDAEPSTLIFSATYKFAYPELPASPIPSPTSTRSSSTTATTDMHALFSAAFQPHQNQNASNQLAPGAVRYPLYVPQSTSWSDSRGNSPMHGGSYHGSSSNSDRDREPSSASTYACFPADLTNYVSLRLVQ